MLGGIMGGGLKAAGAIFAGPSAARAAKKAARNIKEQQKENQEWYDRRYNEDATQRADAQRILTLTEQSIRDRNKEAAGTAAVMGGTEESVAATKAANAQSLADATAQIAVNAESRKDNIEQQYLQRDADLDSQLNQLQMQKAQAISQAVQGVADAGAGIAGIF